MSKRGRNDFDSDLPDGRTGQYAYITRPSTAIVPYVPMQIGRARSYRRSSGGYRKSKYPYRRRMLGPKNRGPYAKVNRVAPELKSREIDTQFFPVGFGNKAGAYTWGAPSNIPANTWTGTAQNGYSRCLNLLGAGTDIFERIGRKVFCKSLLLNITWRLPDRPGDPPPGSPGPLPASIRTIVVWDKQPNGVDINISDFLKPVLNQTGTAAPCPTSPNNLDNRDRFRTLWDCRDTLSPGGDSLRQYEKYIKINRETIFNNGTTSAEIGSVSTGALYVIFLSDLIDASADPTYIYYRPLVSFSSRFRFTDA